MEAQKMLLQWEAGKPGSSGLVEKNEPVGLRRF